MSPLHPHCQTARLALAGNDTPSFDEHARSCAACASFAARLARATRGLASLPQRAAPSALDGRVVAALEAGHREERAIEAVQSLARVDVPEHLAEHLDRAVTRELSKAPPPFTREPLVAPDVLRRLVEEELSDPSKARTRRFVGSLERLRAPEALESKVVAALAAPERTRSFRSRLLFGGSAALLAIAATFVWFTSNRGEVEAARGRIEWVRAESTDELSPLAASLLAGFTGGASDVVVRGGGQ
ncbi:MAG: hypothetical protein L6Q99_05160 [Planctomycetes bacterium]|nr:hypothetical protein [Planctomycetota bacterium]